MQFSDQEIAVASRGLEPMLASPDPNVQNAVKGELLRRCMAMRQQMGGGNGFQPAPPAVPLPTGTKDPRAWSPEQVQFQLNTQAAGWRFTHAWPLYDTIFVRTDADVPVAGQLTYFTRTQNVNGIDVTNIEQPNRVPWAYEIYQAGFGIVMPARVAITDADWTALANQVNVVCNLLEYSSFRFSLTAAEEILLAPALNIPQGCGVQTWATIAIDGSAAEHRVGIFNPQNGSGARDGKWVFPEPVKLQTQDTLFLVQQIEANRVTAIRAILAVAANQPGAPGLGLKWSFYGKRWRPVGHGG